MAGGRPQFPRASRSRRPGAGQQSLFPDVVPHVQPVKSAGPVKPIRSRGKTNPRQPAVMEGPILDPRFRRNYRRAQLSEEDEENYRWIVPTPSINPPRPRTLLAGYNKDQKDLRVVFRDGTQWHYMGVEPVIWERFRRTASPGRFINRVLNYFPYEGTEFEPPTR